MFCPKCGKENRKGAKFCDNCGFPLENINLGEEDNESSESETSAEKAVDVPEKEINNDNNTNEEVLSNYFYVELKKAFDKIKNDYLENDINDSLVDKSDVEVLEIAQHAPYKAKNIFHAQRTAFKILRKGIEGELSDAQLVESYINLTDARKKLSIDEYRDVMKLYEYFMAQTTPYKYNQNRLVEKIANIYAHFDQLAPIDKYTGNYTPDMFSFIEEVRETYKDIDLTPHKGFSSNAFKNNHSTTTTIENNKDSKNKRIIIGLAVIIVLAALIVIEVVLPAINFSYSANFGSFFVKLPSDTSRHIADEEYEVSSFYDDDYYLYYQFDSRPFDEIAYDGDTLHLVNASGENTVRYYDKTTLEIDGYEIIQFNSKMKTDNSTYYGRIYIINTDDDPKNVIMWIYHKPTKDNFEDSQEDCYKFADRIIKSLTITD